MTRSELRENLFKLLFRAEFNAPEEMADQKKYFFEEVPLKDSERDELRTKADNILKNLEKIDESLNDKVTGWKTDRLGKVELTILRLAVYEILYDDAVPTSVAINEAVELAKKFGQDSSSAFVNGVLAKFS